MVKNLQPIEYGGLGVLYLKLAGYNYVCTWKSLQIYFEPQVQVIFMPREGSALMMVIFLFHNCVEVTAIRKGSTERQGQVNSFVHDFQSGHWKKWESYSQVIWLWMVLLEIKFLRPQKEMALKNYTMNYLRFMSNHCYLVLVITGQLPAGVY